MRPKFLFLLILASALIKTSAQSTRQLLDSAAVFPVMPKNAVEIALLQGNFSQRTFASGTPFNDLSYTTFDTDYMEGETAGYDVFYPVDPGDDFPGSNRIKIIQCVSQATTNVVYEAALGDRVILGTADHPQPFFLRGLDGKDNDYVIIRYFDFSNGHIQLKGVATDYRLVKGTLADGVKTEGWYLFYVKNGNIDLVAFIFPCDSLEDTPATYANSLCNTDKALSLDNPNQFRYAQKLNNTSVIAGGFGQIGGSGKEIINGVVADRSGFVYLYGNTDSNLDGKANPSNEMFVAKINPKTRQQVWASEIGELDGALIFDAVTDEQYLYAAGRTFGSLPGHRNKGVWDAVIIKMRLDNGQIVATQQWGESGIDGFGNIILDDAGNLYFSGAGSPAGASVSYGTGDSAFVVAKFRASTLEKVWVQLDPVTPTSTRVAEAWGGISYIPSSQPGRGKLVVGGWYSPSGTPPRGADGFVKIYENLDQAQPSVAATQLVSSQGFRADWVWDNTVDDEGNVYVVGATTGNLQGRHQGEGDAYIIKYSPTLSNPLIRQFGTSRGDMFSRVEFDPKTKSLLLIGYTYGNYQIGDYQGRNADLTGLTGDVIIQKMDKNLNTLAALQLGTAGEERGFGSIQDSLLYIGGMTEAALTGPHQGSFDGFSMALKIRDLTVATPGISTKTNNISRVLNLSVAPNPTSDYLNIELDKGYQVFNALGGLVLQSSEKTTRIYVGALATGIYVLRTEKGVAKFVKN
jgi:hypothetical protein